MEPKTVKIKSDAKDAGGFVIINQADFKEGEHELYVEPREAPSKPPAPPTPASASTEPSKPGSATGGSQEGGKP